MADVKPWFSEQIGRNHGLLEALPSIGCAVLSPKIIRNLRQNLDQLKLTLSFHLVIAYV